MRVRERISVGIWVRCKPIIRFKLTQNGRSRHREEKRNNKKAYGVTVRIPIHHELCFTRADPYVKIALYCEGVRLSKANTRVKRRSTNPVYNEKFNFNVSAEEISLTTVVLKIANHCQAASGAASLGMLVLGFDSFGSGQEHWNSMLESPSRHTEKWHKLHADSTSI